MLLYSHIIQIHVKKSALQILKFKYQRKICIQFARFCGSKVFAIWILAKINCKPEDKIDGYSKEEKKASGHFMKWYGTMGKVFD